MVVIDSTKMFFLSHKIGIIFLRKVTMHHFYTMHNLLHKFIAIFRGCEETI